MSRLQPGSKLPRAGWVGPLFAWELIRLARRGQDMRGRFLLAMALLFILTLFAIFWFRYLTPTEIFTGTAQSMSLEESARFGEVFAILFVLTQLAVMCLLTPAYAAGGVSEEKEKKTLVFLLVSDLSNREILFGKFLGRVVFLLGILFAGLPILALTQLYGGVSLNYLIVSYAITTATTIMLAGISACCALYADSYRGALFRAYSLTALAVVVGFGIPYLSPLAVLIILSNIQGSAPEFFWLFGLGYPTIQLMIALGAVVLATYKIRWMRVAPKRSLADPFEQNCQTTQRRKPSLINKARPVPLQTAQLLSTTDVPIDLAPETLRRETTMTEVPENKPMLARQAQEPRFRRRLRPPPTRRPVLGAAHRNRPRIDEEQPFLWKERYVTGRRSLGDDQSIKSVMVALGLTIGSVVGLIGLVMLAAVVLSNFKPGAIRVFSNFSLTVGVSGYAVYLLMLGSGAITAILRERQQQTLESLLIIPVDRIEILWAKWRVNIIKVWPLGVLSIGLLTLGFAASTMPYYALIVLAGLALSPFAIVSYGLWLSMRCTTATKAVMWLLIGVAITAGLPMIAAIFPDDASEWTWLPITAIHSLLIASCGWMFYRLARREFAK